LRALHEPHSLAEALAAQKRFALEELFLVLFQSAYVKEYLSSVRAHAQTFHEKELKDFVSNLPFKLTDDQRKAAWAVLMDLQKTSPMNRLIEGDVGSGKTVVAAMALYHTLLNGHQGAFMAPTSILARQQYEALRAMLPSSFPVALLTQSTQLLNGKNIAKKELTAMIATGEVALTVGTHALIAQRVSFR